MATASGSITVHRRINGKDGKDGQSTLWSTVFTRSNATEVAAPTGGSYSSPVPTDTAWSDGVPAGTAALWMSTRIFTSNGAAPQQSAWSTPRQVSDTSTIDFEFSNYTGSDPGNPDTPKNSAVWYDPDDTTQDRTKAVWMAVRTVKNGVNGTWQVTKIKGEDGADGTGIIPKGVAYGYYETKDEWDAAGHDTNKPLILIKSYTHSSESVTYNVFYDYMQTGQVYSWVYKYATTIGDAYTMSSADSQPDIDGHLFVATDTGWVDMGVFKGEQGEPGADGADGADGEDAVVYDIETSVSQISASNDGTVKTGAITVTAYCTIGAADRTQLATALSSAVSSYHALQYSVDGGTWTRCSASGVYSIISASVVQTATSQIEVRLVRIDPTAGTTTVLKAGHVLAVVKDGLQGISGLIVRVSEWTNGQNYRNDSNITTEGLRFLDVAAIANDSSDVGWDFYQCLSTHDASASNHPVSGTVTPSLWEQVTNVGPIYTSLLIAKNAKIAGFTISGNKFIYLNEDGTTAITLGFDGEMQVPGEDYTYTHDTQSSSASYSDTNYTASAVTASASNNRGTYTTTKFKLTDSDGNDVTSSCGSVNGKTVTATLTVVMFMSSDPDYLFIHNIVAKTIALDSDYQTKTITCTLTETNLATTKTYSIYSGNTDFSIATYSVYKPTLPICTLKIEVQIASDNPTGELYTMLKAGFDISVGEIVCFTETPITQMGLMLFPDGFGYYGGSNRYFSFANDDAKGCKIRVGQYCWRITADRGIQMSKDGGYTWQTVLS